MALLDWWEEKVEEALRLERERIPTPEEYRDSTLHDLLWQDGLLRRLLPPVKIEGKELKEIKDKLKGEEEEPNKDEKVCYDKG